MFSLIVSVCFVQGAVQMNLRKLLVIDTVLDYDYTGANPKHDRKGKPGSGGKNP